MKFVVFVYTLCVTYNLNNLGVKSMTKCAKCFNVFVSANVVRITK